MKTKVAAILLAFFLGCWGIHWFYLGKNGKGVVYLIIGFFGLFFWFPLLVTGVLSLIDFIGFLCDSEERFNAKYNYNNSHFASMQQQTTQYNTQQSNMFQSMQEVQSQSKTEKLFDLKKLLDDGVLTLDEFETEKRKILDS